MEILIAPNLSGNFLIPGQGPLLRKALPADSLPL